MRYARSGLSLMLGLVLALATVASAATTPPPVVIPWEQWAPTLGAASVTYADGRFIAVGGGSVSASTDGMNWQVVHEDPPPKGATPGYALPSLHAVTYGQGRFVAVGNPWFRVMTSTDGTTWSSSDQWTGDRAQGPYRQLTDVTYGGDRFVAVGQSAGASETIASTDGLQWSHSPKFPDTMLNAVAYDGHRFLAVGAKTGTETSTGGVWTSPDGLAWTPVDVALPVLQGLVYSDGRFVAVADTSSDGSYSFTSTDGSHWTQARLPGSVAGRLSASGGYYSVPLGDKLLGLSRDGLNWLQTTAPASTKQVVVAGGRFLAAGSGISGLSPCGGFIDLAAKDPACKAVTTVQEAGAITGYPDGTFRAAGAVSRAEFAKMLTVALGKSPAPGGPLAFSDTQGHWAALQGYLQTAVQLRAITGYPDGTFRPDAQVSRAELIKMVVGAMGLQLPYLAAYYGDVDSSDWFFPPVNAAGRARLIGPNAVAPLWPGPTLQPAQAATRAETAMLLANLLAVKETVQAPSISAWTLSTIAPECGTDTRVLRIGVERRPAENGQVNVFLHNNTNLCHEPGASQKLTGSTVQLAIYPVGNETGEPLVSFPMNDLPAELTPGQLASRTADVGKRLPPGWYTAKLTGQVLVNGESYSFTSDNNASGNFLVSTTDITSGRTTQAGNPAPVVGGVAMPLVQAEWTTDRTLVQVQIPVGCTGNRDQSVALTKVTAFARGPGFESQLPELGSVGDESSWSWQFAWVPGESKDVIVKADASVVQCNGTTPGAQVASGPVEWIVPLR